MKNYDMIISGQSVWFTSDTHFCHEAIIRMNGRPFGSVEAMNKALIDNFRRLHIADFFVKVRHTLNVASIGNFSNFSNRQLLDIQKKLNRRPREKLNFDSPKNIFFNYLNLYHLQLDSAGT